MRFVLALATILTLGGPAGAQDTSSGAYYLVACRLAFPTAKRDTLVEFTKAGICQGFIRAAVSFAPVLSEQYRFCAPKEATGEQAVMILVKFLSEHPERLHENIEPLIVDTFRAVWPCR